MNEYDLYVPIIVRGRRLPARELSLLKKRLIKKFGGLTHFPQKTKGSWKIGHATFEDEIVILRVLADTNFPSFWKTLKRDLQKQWGQKEILIIVRQVRILS